jgi:hypothetical protein
VVFLNLTFWTPEEQGDVLSGERIDADVVMHVAWHHLARRALAGAPLTAGAMSTSPATSSGRSSAASSAIAPPMECPTSVARRTPTASMISTA